MATENKIIIPSHDINEAMEKMDNILISTLKTHLEKDLKTLDIKKNSDSSLDK